ncbi:hypothetical protein [Geotalea sp. SG265]|uniref:hypothetical protein n=1 Tax=Geotalea sp. SG265 TaxID=2922867 RepID=UPI001FAFD67D|nr:hypothetical protein [Geotalea sp. SG265]
MATPASQPRSADLSASTEPVKAPVKPAGAADFDASVFSDAAREPADRHAPHVGSGGPFFFRNDPGAKQAQGVDGQGDVVVEITESNDFEEVEELDGAGIAADESLAEVFSSEPAATPKPEPGYDSFADFVERQKKESAKTPAAMGGDGAALREPVTRGVAEMATATPRVPEVVTSANGQLPASPLAGRAERGIITKLDEHGMTDDYVVQMVQEICHAVKYVEGVEKPDWPTRMMGLDMLCKIRGLYAGEKKEDPANRQLQIVAGINM